MSTPRLFMRHTPQTEFFNAKTQRSEDAKHLNRAPAGSGVSDEPPAIAAELLRNAFCVFAPLRLCVKSDFPRIPSIPRFTLRSLRSLL